MPSRPAGRSPRTSTGPTKYRARSTAAAPRQRAVAGDPPGLPHRHLSDTPCPRSRDPVGELTRVPRYRRRSRSTCRPRGELPDRALVDRGAPSPAIPAPASPTRWWCRPSPGWGRDPPTAWSWSLRIAARSRCPWSPGSRPRSPARHESRRWWSTVVVVGPAQALATDSQVPRTPYPQGSGHDHVTISSPFGGAGTARNGGVRDVPGASAAPPSQARPQTGSSASRKRRPTRVASRRSRRRPARSPDTSAPPGCGVSTGSTTGGRPVHPAPSATTGDGLTRDRDFGTTSSAPSSPRDRLRLVRMTPWPSSSASTSGGTRFWRPRSPRPGACRAPPTYDAGPPESGAAGRKDADQAVGRSPGTRQVSGRSGSPPAGFRRRLGGSGCASPHLHRGATRACRPASERFRRTGRCSTTARELRGPRRSDPRRDRGAGTALLVTMGTGISGAVVLDGEVRQGFNGMAGSSATWVVPGGHACGMRQGGLLNRYSSGNAWCGSPGRDRRRPHHPRRACEGDPGQTDRAMVHRRRGRQRHRGTYARSPQSGTGWAWGWPTWWRHFDPRSS